MWHRTLCSTARTATRSRSKLVSRGPTPLIALVCLLCGCSLAELSERDPTIAVNECSKDGGCPEGQRCSALGCVAPLGTLSSLLFEVLPGISADSSATRQFFKQLTIPLVPTATNLGSNFKQEFVSLSLPDTVTVSGNISANGCDLTFQDQTKTSPLPRSTDASLPARITFVPSETMWNLAATAATTTTTFRATSVGEQTFPDYSFRALLPGGSYDVYVEPFPVAEAPPGQAKSCTVLPQLFRAQNLEGSTSLKLALATPKHLDLTVRFPESTQNLDGWHVDMLESVSGRVVSNTVELELPTRSDGALVYSVPLDYVPVWGDDPKLTHGELVRLSPPAKLLAPTLFFWREGLEWATAGSGVIDQLGSFPSAVSYAGTVVDPNATGVSATVTFTATEVEGVSSGLFPSFIRTAEAGTDGRFQVDLLPGNYKVITAPHSDTSERPFALATTELTVLGAPSAQAGRTLTVGPALLLQGNAFTPQGDGARGAFVTAEASPARVATNIFERAIGELASVPRAVGDVINDPSGSFQLFAEPGIYDLSVRPPANSNFAWLVIPGFEPALGAGKELDVTLPDLRLPAPLPLELLVGWKARPDSAALLQAASIRAYALVDASGEPTTDAKAAVAAVRIAEGRLNDAGRVTMMLPAKLDRPPDGFTSNPAPQP